MVDGDIPQLTAEFSWLARLSPAGDMTGLTPASSQAQRAHVLAVVGGQPLDWGVELGRRVAEDIVAEMPVYARDAEGFEALRTGTESTTLQLLTVLAGDRVEQGVTPESLSAVTDFVHRRIGLDEMLRGIQLGHATMASALLAECGRLGAPGETLVQMRALSDRMFRFFDMFSGEMAAYYREEEQRWAGSDTAARFGMLSDLLAGSTPDAAIERKLGYSMVGPHVAIVAVSEPAAAVDGLVSAIATVLERARFTHHIVVPTGSGQVWAWASPASRELLDAAMAAGTLPPHMRAVAGSIAAGVSGFRLSHEEASTALSVLRATPPTGAIVPYTDVDVLSLLMSDSARAKAFAERELGGLGAATPQARELRRTVAAFIDEQGSPFAAAQRLNVSRNTVSYRVHRAEELLGRGLGDRRFQLRCALLIRDLADAEDADEQHDRSR